MDHSRDHSKNHRLFCSLEFLMAFGWMPNCESLLAYIAMDQIFIPFEIYIITILRLKVFGYNIIDFFFYTQIAMEFLETLFLIVVMLFKFLKQI